jgi:hypothetical protein
MSESNDIQQNNEQLLNDIQSLQKIEQQLFDSLETNTNLTTKQQQQIIEKMNQLSNMRINLYQTLSGVNNYFQNALTSSQGTLTSQTAAIGIVENELNQSKRRLAILEAEKNNKIRLVQINDYYGNKYAEHSNLMKIIIFTLVPVILLAILNNKGILPNTIYFILIVIIAAIGGYFFWIRFGSIITRDNMNYQSYDWYFDASKAPSASGSSDSDPWASTNVGSCIGSACCSDGQTYDESLDQCLGSSTLETTTNTTTSSTTSTTEGFVTESMVANILSKGSLNKYNNEIIYDGDNRVKANPSNSFY